VDVLGSCSDPADKQFRSRDVFEIEVKFARSRSRQEGLAGTPGTEDENAISYKTIAFLLAWFQMGLHELADPLLRAVHTPDVGKQLSRGIRIISRCSTRGRAADPVVTTGTNRGSCRNLEQKIQKNETTQPIEVRPRSRTQKGPSGLFCSPVLITGSQMSDYTPCLKAGASRAMPAIAGMAVLTRSPRRSISNAASLSESLLESQPIWFYFDLLLIAAVAAA
jgi:hypothetical protein